MLSFRRQVFGTLVIQGGGAAAALISVLLLGFFLGPTAQGVFSRVKAEVEFIGALAMLGLPQSMFYFVQSGRMSLSRARLLAAAAALVGAAAGLLNAMVGLHWPVAEALALTLAATAFTWHGCLRGVVLSATDSTLFNLVTAAPQVLLLSYAAWATLTGEVSRSQAGLALALFFAAISLLALHFLRRRARPIPRSAAGEERLLNVTAYGLASGIGGIGATLAVLLAIRTVQRTSGPEILGVFTLSVALVQGLLVPLNYTVPLLFKRWMERPAAFAAVRGGLMTTAILAALALVVRQVGEFTLVSATLGRYATMQAFLWILMLGAAADACQRIVAVAANARGLPWLAAVSEALRVLVVFVGVTMLGVASVLDVAWLLCIASLAAATMLMACYLFSVRSCARQVP